MDELDTQFGPVISAQNGMKHWEIQQSLKYYELNQDSARELTQLLSLAVSGQLGLRIVQSLTFLWVVNQDGDLIFALEETIDLEGTLRRPRMRGTPLGSSVKPLGHPLLVAGGGARIGGELYLDDADEPGEVIWVLNNQSGRYGVHASRTSQHLENAADLFRRHRIPVETDFRPIG